MLRYTLRQLEYFVTAAELGSIAKAAERLNVSQPSVSAALAKLEDQLGVQLLVRHHAQGVSLTPAGRRQLAAARNLLSHAEEMQREAAAAGEEIAGELQIGAFVTLAAAFMPALIAGFRDRHPSVTLGLHEGTQEDLAAGLRQGRFELALLYSVDVPEDIHLTALAAFEPYVLLPAHHALARSAAVSLRDLAGEPLILLDVPPSRAYFLGLLAKAAVKPEITFSSPSLELVRGLVGRGLGYSLLVTRPYGDRTYEGEELAVRPISEAAERGAVALARLSRLHPTRTMAAFSEFCSAWFAARTRAPESGV